MKYNVAGRNDRLVQTSTEKLSQIHKEATGKAL
jgi:hypothetical protein